MSKLVIVESPAKCSKIAGYLGAGWSVMASMGHIRGLDESLEALKIGTWDPTYVELPTKKETIAKLKAAAKKADEVWIATDDDREGEGIAWHVCTVLGLPIATTKRIVFHEITKTAILAAAATPTTLNLPKFYSQQTRSMLDMLIGFTISKVLWTRVPSAKSAGRCQTPALRLVMERDTEVEAHEAISSWMLQGTFEPPVKPAIPISPLEGTAKEALPTREATLAILTKIHINRNVVIKDVQEKVSINNAPRPLITSTLQQEASSLYGFSPKQTMSAAQKLYEGGHITYMRTDHAVLSREAVLALRNQIKTRFGEEYQGTFGQSIASAGAQAAHEAIRPTHAENQTVEADSAGSRLYQLIWRRAMQSQMASSKTDVRSYTLMFEAEPERVWVSEQSKIQFAGWKILEPTKDDAKESIYWKAWEPYAKVGTKLIWTTLAGHERFTKPSPRYTEASLVRELERKGIGRPSTFASLIATLQDREYVEKTNVEGKEQETHHLLIPTSATWPPKEEIVKHTVGAEKNKLRVTPIGRSAVQFLAKEFDDLFSYDYTAKMETELDHIATGEKEWKSLLQEIWDSYKERYISFTGKEAKAANKASLIRVLSPTVQVAQTRKGPFVIRPPPDGSSKEVKAEYAPLPKGATFETISLIQAESALEAAKVAKEGVLLGVWEGAPVLKKKGPYGFYATWSQGDVTVNVPFKPDDTLETIQAKLLAKRSPSETRTIGDFTIKNGPFGYYCFNHTLKKAIFVKWPADTDFKTATIDEVSTIYSAGAAKKRAGGGRGGRGGWRGRGGKK